MPLACLYLILRRKNTKQRAHDHTSPWHAQDNWRLNGPCVHHEHVQIGETRYEVAAEELTPSQFVMSFDTFSVLLNGTIEGTTLTATIDGHRQNAIVMEGDSGISLFISTADCVFNEVLPDLGEDHDHDDGSGFKAPMNGTVVAILVNTTDEVSAGDPLIIMEAMKMEHTIKAPANGTVNEIFYAIGDLVDGGADLLSFTPAE